MGSKRRLASGLVLLAVAASGTSQAAPASSASTPGAGAPAPAPTRSPPPPAVPSSADAPGEAKPPAPGEAKPPAPAAKPPAPAAKPPAPAAKPPAAAAKPPAAAAKLPASPAKPSTAKPAAASKASSRSATAAPAGNGAPSKESRSEKAQDTAIRRSVAGGPTFDDTASGADTPELRALHAAERELFPPASASSFAPWPSEVPFPVAATEDRPRVHASGLPPTPVASAPPLAEGAKDMGWLAKLELPDLPVRWDPRVVRYLDFFKDDPRGRSTMTIWLRRSGRYRDGIRKVLRKKGLPEDLTWLAMIESGFDPAARSPVGAVGLWQFMPDTGKIYGLTHDRWSDQRLSPTTATEAAADFLADLYRRFGSWDLAMAAYNVGYGGMLSIVRRYNTNDFWALARLEGSLPWETTLYVPKILAASIVMKNLAAFGYQDVMVEPPLEGDEVLVAPGTTLAAVAQACGTTTKEVELLNPDLRASRTPPAQEDWRVLVPAGKASGCSQNLARSRKDPSQPERYVVRFGESLEQIAEARQVSVAKLVEMNAIGPGEVVRGGTVLLVPKADATTEVKPASLPAKGKSAARGPSGDTPVVVVPPDIFVYPDRRRVFYRVQLADTVREIATAFNVTPDDLRRWNGVDPAARLVEGMTLQLFVGRDADLSGAVALEESDVRVIVAGSEEFFSHFDDKGRRRLVVTARAGDTLESIGKKHGCSVGLMERINRRGRREALAEGDSVVVWAPGAAGGARGAAAATAAPGPLVASRTSGAEPEPTVPLETPPAPDRLPALP